MADRATQVWLVDIRNEIAGISDLTANASLEEFSASWAMKRAIQHALLIIAEAAKHIPTEQKIEHANVPWSKIHGLGNLLRHEYRRVDAAILWSVVTEHLETLDRAAAALIARSEDS